MINRARIHMEPKVSDLQANAKLVQKDECWTLNQRPGFYPHCTLKEYQRTLTIATISKVSDSVSH